MNINFINNISKINKTIKNINSPNISFTSNNDSFEKSITIKGSETEAKIYAPSIDNNTYLQIKNICDHPVFKNLPIRIMPDTHAGKTVVVGFTAPIGERGEILPGLISGDIGCGMRCTKINVKKEDIDFEKLDKIIRTYIGSSHGKYPETKKEIIKEIDPKVRELCKKKLSISGDKGISGLGTLGTGNHFIELDEDKNGNLYLVVHTGSRNFGQAIFNHHNEIAMKQNPYRIKELSYLTGEEAKEYLEDMRLAQKFSEVNREIITKEILHHMGWEEIDSFESIHNYINEDNIIRKGAISSKAGEKAIIPLNMRDGALIVTGKGNNEWNASAPHGAGRILSRGEASKQISLDSYKKSMEGIYTSCVCKETIDEAPQTYKSPEIIKEFIEPTAKIEEQIRPIYNFKN